MCLGMLSGFEDSSSRLAATQIGGPLISNSHPSGSGGEILVRFKRGAPAFEQAVAHGWARARRCVHSSTSRASNWYGSQDISVREALSQYRRHPDVLYAEPNQVVTATIRARPGFPSLGPAQHRAVRRHSRRGHRCAGGVEHHDRKPRRRRGSHRHGHRLHASGSRGEHVPQHRRLQRQRRRRRRQRVRRRLLRHRRDEQRLRPDGRQPPRDARRRERSARSATTASASSA